MQSIYITATPANTTERIANLVALSSAGGPRLALTNNYRLKFDCYLRVSPTVTLSAAGYPIPLVGAVHLLGHGSAASMQLGAAQLDHDSLVQRAAELDWSTLKGLSTVGITAGASAPELLVNEIIDAFRAHYDVTVETVTLREENVTFKLPRELREVPATP